MTPKVSNSSSLSIGVDIGGTTSRAALVDDCGNVVKSTHRPSPQEYEEFVRWICTAVSALCEAHPVPFKIRLALPGVVDRDRGTVIRSVNLPWLEGQPIVDQLERETGLRPTLLTDAEAATWGEFVDSGGPASPFAHLRLGTGVACGVVVEGRLIPTDPTRRTHWPILIVDQRPAAPKCPCGLSGCLELFASGNSLVNKAGEFGVGRTLDDLRTGYEAGDECVIDLLDCAANAVARAVENLVKAYDVKLVVLGGGVLKALPLLFTSIQQITESAVLIRLSRLRDDAGIVGAARFPDPSGL